MDSQKRSLVFVCFSYVLFFTNPFALVADSLSQGQQLKKGQPLFSDAKTFTLEFFSPDDDTNGWYLGISYRLDNENKVWVANRDNPIFDDSLILTIDDIGSLVIKYGRKSLPLYLVEKATSTIVTLEETGNLVLRDNATRRVLWQSFDHPTDTLLQRMKLGFNRRTGQTWNLTSWRNENLPALGSFTLGIDPKYPNQLTIWWRGEIYWRSGLWKQELGTFSISSNLTSTPFNYYYYYANGTSFDIFFNEVNTSRIVDYNFHYNSTKDEVYFTYSVKASTVNPGSTLKFPRLTISPSGNVYKGPVPSDVTCTVSSTGITRDSGCKMHPECIGHLAYGFFDVEKAFVSTKGLKLIYNVSWYDCDLMCRRNCSCLAYYSEGPVCEIWSKGTKFIQTNSEDPSGLTINFIGTYEKAGNRSVKITLISIGGIVGGLIFCYISYVIIKKCKEVERRIMRAMLIKETRCHTVESSLHDSADERGKVCNSGNEIQIFSFRSIATATNNFSVANKLGEGGFGSVYKGKLPGGQDIAIKRLSKRSKQGLVEFKNEAILIGKLQHTSLVRLLGFCVEKEERILAYEYLHNKSLDFYIFDSERKKLLDWKKRFNIIERIAQGLIYLHIYSRLTIIHRDLKASNILLDNEMNPKISDFGLARIFELKGGEETTKKIVGTFGYMSPEYAMNGIISIKTDVFSFGILVLEIVSGRRNSSRHHSDYLPNLIGLAWQLWNDGKVMELIDKSLLDCCPIDEAERCVQLGLLCAQDHAADRPSMLEVVSMLSDVTASLPAPKMPAFFIDIEADEPRGFEEMQNSFSLNGVTISVSDAR